MEQPQHLGDLFKVGVLHDVVAQLPDGTTQTVTLWIRKPTPEQQAEARVKAQGQAARIKSRYRDANSEEYAALWDEIDELENDAAVAAKLVELDTVDIRNRAFQEVMFSEDVGGDWTEAGEDYYGVVQAMSDRLDEVMRHNEALDEADADMRIDPNADEELNRLDARLKSFNQEVADREAHLVAQARAKIMSSGQDLRKQLAKRYVDMEAQMAWYQEYRLRMLHYACRYPDQRRRLYFRAREDILDLPIPVQNELFDVYDSLTAVNPKELAIPQSSSPS